MKKLIVVTAAICALTIQAADYFYCGSSSLHVNKVAWAPVDQAAADPKPLEAITSGKLAFAPGAKIVVKNRTSTASAEPVVLARATGGITGVPAIEGLRRSAEVKDGALLLRRQGLIMVIR